VIKRKIGAFLEFIRDVEAQHTGVYHATADELEAIDEADASGIATDAELEAAFRTFRSS
jgi:hypothetical protein